MIYLHKTNILILLFILLIICINCLYYYYNIYTSYYINFRSHNIRRHKNSDALYAHFSAVDTFNYVLFPKLIFTHPIYFTLKKNQSIYIPKKWWHWIKTTTKSFAINFWFNNENVENNNEPFIFDNLYSYNYNNILKDESVSVWDSNNNDILNDNRINFNTFYNSKMDNKYIITVDDYSLNNNNIKKKMKSYIKFPENSNINTSTFDYNIWVSSGIHDTGLHYDDEDGILSLLDGEKEIILFPPSDSEYLYPYTVSYEWLSSDAYDFRYNSYQKNEKIDGKSSSQLLYETCKSNLKVLANISKLYYKFDKKDIIWGFKKNKDIYRWELYQFTLNNNRCVNSYDIFNNEYDIGIEEHYYYNMDKEVKLPFWGYGKYKKNNIIHYESKIFVIDTYDSFYNNYNNHMDKLEYSDIKDDFKTIILEKYKCYELCIFNKNPNQIFVMYLGISNEDFLEFLISNDYPKNIIDFVNTDNYHINNEITIVYDITTKQIIRSGFYGHL